MYGSRTNNVQVHFQVADELYMDMVVFCKHVELENEDGLSVSCTRIECEGGISIC